MASSAGTKVTTDPTARTNPIAEPAGVITSDSLAAESIKSGGGFASNPRAGIMDQPSASTTTNTTDTSAARVLGPAPDAESRDVQQEWREQQEGQEGQKQKQKQEGGGGGGDHGGEERGQQGDTGGQQTNGGSHADKRSGGDANAAPAPSYIQGGTPGTQAAMKPHGRNLKEGEGFEGNEPNASFESEIGSEDDPGRVAEGQFLHQKAQIDADAAGGNRQKGSGGDGGAYDVLEETSA